jgi:hypothetical protein
VLIAIRHLKQVVPQMNPKEILTTLSMGFSLSKKEKATLLISRLQGWNLLRQDNEIPFFRNRQNEFKEFFFFVNDLVFCNEFCCVMEALGHQHDPFEWRWFDSSKVGLKAVFLPSGKNSHPYP